MPSSPAAIALFFALGCLCAGGSASHGVPVFVLLGLALLVRPRGGIALCLSAFAFAYLMTPSFELRSVEATLGRVEGPVSRRAEVQRFSLSNGVRVTWRGRRIDAGNWVAVRGRAVANRYQGTHGLDEPRWRWARGELAFMKASSLLLLDDASSWRWTAAESSQRAVSEGIAKHMSGQAAAVARAMLSGDRTGLSDESYQVYRRAGLSHVLAVSGLHLAVVTWLLMLAFRSLLAGLCRARGPPLAALLALLGAVAFTFMTGARISTMRALSVAAVVLIGRVLLRRGRAEDALGFAVLLLLVVQPAMVWDPSFQLSVSACVSLLMIPRGLGLVTRSICAALYPTLMTAPLVVFWFGEVAPAGLVSNLVAVPLVVFVVVPGLTLAVLLSTMSDALAGGVFACVEWVLRLLHSLAAWVGRVVPAQEIARPSVVALVLACSSTTLALWALGRRRWWVAAVSVVAASAILIVPPWLRSWSRHDSRDLRIAFVDVGQGDAALVEFPGGAVWLIDGGGSPGPSSPGRDALIPYLRHRGIRRIDVMVLSHAHPDHMLGLIEVAKSMPVAELWLGGSCRGQLRPLCQSVSRTGGQVRVAPHRRRLRSAGVTALVLGPGPALEAADDPKLNDLSLVLLLEYAGRRVLFTGDIEAQGEEVLVNSWPAIDAIDVLKVPHHGSKTSSGEGLIARLAPRLAVLSCGSGNRFGHPSAKVLTRYREHGTAIRRTDLHGTVVVRIAVGGTLLVSSAAGNALDLRF